MVNFVTLLVSCNKCVESQLRYFHIIFSFYGKRALKQCSEWLSNKSAKKLIINLPSLVFTNV